MGSPISVSAPGNSLTTASGSKLSLSTLNPFAKIDSTNDASFQLITLFFAVEPPNPDGTISKYQRTLIYSFPHGYNYIPSTWFLLEVESSLFGTDSIYNILNTGNAPTVPFGPEGMYIVGGGDFPGFSAAVLIATVDTTNVNFYIDKYYDAGSGLGAPSILGQFVTIRSYIFVNDLLGLDVPTHE